MAIYWLTRKHQYRYGALISGPLALKKSRIRMTRKGNKLQSRLVTTLLVNPAHIGYTCDLRTLTEDTEASDVSADNSVCDKRPEGDCEVKGRAWDWPSQGMCCNLCYRL